MKRYLFLISALILFFSFVCLGNMHAQTTDSLRLSVLKETLDRAVQIDSSYNEKMDFSVSNMSIAELFKNIAKVSGVNINVNFSAERSITCNFKQIRIIDILFFVCKEYGLDVELVGNILSVNLYRAPIKEPKLKIDYDPDKKEVSFDFTDAKLVNVAKSFSQKTGVNIVVPQKLFAYKVSSFGNSMAIDEAIQSIAVVNALIAQKKDKTTWTMYQGNEDKNEAQQSRFSFSMDELSVDSLGLVTARISNGNIRNILPDICRRLKLNYFFTDNLDHPTGIYVEKVDINSFLKVLFTGTNFTWRIENGIYLFGKVNENGSLSSIRVIPMKFRTVDKVMETIPAELKNGVEILTFPDLNSLVASGDQRKLMQLISFIGEIDKSVPLISIDVIIVDATDSSTREAGVSMGLGKEPATTSGTLSPGVNFSLNANSVNKLINSFNGFGSINLGKVSPNFYMGLKLLEENGKVLLRSTPKLATLNGHKATLKSGETKYYKETQTNIIGTQNPLQSESYQWKNVEASLTLDIVPYVSLDSCITLKIDLSQSEFTERESEDAPPGATTRSFNSIIKVRNQEMVLLGGIEKSLSNQSSSGLPLIARIPILKWLFGSSSKSKKLQKLNIFIKPSIIE
jgi:type IV pilus assembly protein PilQ